MDGSEWVALDCSVLEQGYMDWVLVSVGSVHELVLEYRVLEFSELVCMGLDCMI